MIETICETCGHSYKNQLGDLICVCDRSEHCADYVEPDGTCDWWKA